MSPSDREQLKADVMQVEAFRASAYKDSEGYWTIGYGRMIDARKGGGLSQGEAMFLLANDLAIAEKECRTHPWFEGLSPARQRVIVEMAFNLGMPGVLKFERMIAALLRFDYDTAADQMLQSLWAQQVKGRAVRLANAMRAG